MYKVTCLYGGTTYTLHDPTSDVLRIYNDQIETEDSKPGSFQFSVSYDHPHLDKIVGLSSDIRVYDGTEEIFRGRPVDDGEDLYRERTFKCEGELAFLYDSIQPRRELHSVSPLAFFTLLIDEHNNQVKNRGPIDKTFRVGIVTVTDSNNSLYRYTNRETTYEDIMDKLIGRLGGHLRVRVSGSYRYLDLLADVDTVGDQPIQLGENLMDYAKDTDYTQVATACIPLGASLEETEIAALDAYTTVESVNSGSDVIQITEAVNRFGFICKVVSFDDITVPANLLSAGTKWLTDGQYADMTLNLTAVDLHGLGYNVQPIRTNTKVRVLSQPHGMDRFFEVSKRTYHLSQPETDTVTFGTRIKQSYTSSSSKKVSAVTKHTEQIRQNIDSVIEKERENVSNIINQATHGYVVMDPNDGPERILIMDTNSIDSAQKIWKWDMNGLGYSKNGINGPWGVAITMNGQISADYILTGELDASLIKVGKIQDVTGKNYWNMETGEFSMSSETKIGDETAGSVISRLSQAEGQISSEVTRAETAENSLYSRIVQTEGQISSEVSRAETAEKNLSSRITQTAEAIESKVSKGDVESIIEQKADSIRLKADKISWDSTYSSMSNDGTLKCRNANISGTIDNVSGGDGVRVESTGGNIVFYYNNQEAARLQWIYDSAGRSGLQITTNGLLTFRDNYNNETGYTGTLPIGDGYNYSIKVRNGIITGWS